MNRSNFPVLALCAVFFVAGCKKKDDDTPAPAPPPPAPTYPISGPPSMSLNAAGTTVVYQEGTAGFVNVNSAVTNPPTATYSSRFYNDDTETTGASVYFFNNTFSGPQPTDEEFYAFFAPGTRSWSTFGSTSEGVSVSYTTGTGISAGSNTTSMIAQPASSTFTITESEPVDDGSGVTKVKVRATYNCTTISTSNGNQTTVTNGIFVGVFKKQ